MSKEGRVEYGPEKNNLDTKVPLKPGMILHIPANEWHVFRYGQRGFVDILFMYAEVM